jgi:hypothetical protein
MKIGRSLVAEKFNENSLNPARANRGDEAAQELHLPCIELHERRRRSGVTLKTAKGA